MKDHEFLELLNLYLDHEISAADASRLEAEVQRRPERRATYLEYCRMQKACTLLSKDFAGEPADRKVADFEPSRAAWASGTFAAVGGLAVAACVALVLVNRSPDASNAAAPARRNAVVAASSAPEKAAPVAETMVQVPSPVAENRSTGAIASTVSVPARRSEVRSMFVTTPLGQAVVNPESAAVLATMQQNAQAQFEWMKAVQLAPMQLPSPDELRIDGRTPPPPARRDANGRPVQGSVEWVAFKYHK